MLFYSLQELFPIDTPRPSSIFFLARSFPEAGIFLASPGLGSLKPPQEDKISKTKNAGMIFFRTFDKFDIFFINAYRVQINSKKA